MTVQTSPRHPTPSTPGLALLCAGLLCVAGTGADASTKKPRASRPASAPTTAQILAPSQATVPDALPPERTVYRCGNAYSARPCAASQKPLDVADARTDAQRRQAEDVTSRDKRLAAWLEAERRQRETPASAPRPVRAAGAGPTCVETAAITCQPRKPRPRHAVHKAASGAAGHSPTLSTDQRPISDRRARRSTRARRRSARRR